MLSTVPPTRYNIPQNKYRPEFGSFGTGPVASRPAAVRATAARVGGYPDMENEQKLTPTQYHNTIRLISIIVGHNDKKLIASILGDDIPKSISIDMGNLFHARFSATNKNSIYHMIRDIVENYDLGVNLRNLARLTTYYERVPVGDESQQERIRRQDLAVEYRTACLDLQSRTVESLTQHISEVREEGIAGLVQISRLQQLCQLIQKDPFDFEGLDVDIKEEPYWRLVDEKKKQFWLDRYNENVVAWYWTFRGVIDIKATIAKEPMKSYSKYEFAHVCDQMWNKIIAHDVYREERVQIANTHVRSMAVARITHADQVSESRFPFEYSANFSQTAYRELCGKFLDHYEGDEDIRIESLGDIMVPPRSFSTKNGFVQEATREYTTAVTKDYKMKTRNAAAAAAANA